jgi:hypothetical protein
LPRQYRTFVSACGGTYVSAWCPALEPTPFGEHGVTYFAEPKEVFEFLYSMITPRNMITIGSGDFGAFTCLSVAGIDRGAVYALDSEFRASWSDKEFRRRFPGLAKSIAKWLDLRSRGKLQQKPAGYDHLYLLAESFDGYLKRCHATVRS